jgi:hypothetical protein
MECLFQLQHGKITARDLYIMSIQRDSIVPRITHIIDCEAYTWQKKTFLREISVWERLDNSIKTYHGTRQTPCCLMNMIVAYVTK